VTSGMTEQKRRTEMEAKDKKDERILIIDDNPFDEEREKRKRKTVLVVDDDSDFVEIERSLLEFEGYKVDVAFNGDECLKKVRQNKPDLIVLDIMMKLEYEGVIVAQYLRDQKETRDIPIIVVTSKPIYSIYPDDEWRPTDEFINKPIHKNDFLEKVREVLKI